MLRYQICLSSPLGAPIYHFRTLFARRTGDHDQWRWCAKSVRKKRYVGVPKGLLAWTLPI